MVEKTIQLYSYDELSNETKTKLFYEWNSNGCDWDIQDLTDEANNTIDTFCKYFDVILVKCCYNSVYANDFSFNIRSSSYYGPEDINNSTRLRTYVINNYASYYETGKYYCTPGRYENGKYTYKDRRSNIIKTRNCVLTGCIYDEWIMNPLYDFIDGKTEYNTYYDLINACISNFITCVDGEIDYISGREYFEEAIHDGRLYENALFFGNGVEYKGAV